MVATLCGFATWRYGFSLAIGVTLAEIPALVVLERGLETWRGRRAEEEKALRDQVELARGLAGGAQLELGKLRTELEELKQRVVALNNRVGTR